MIVFSPYYCTIPLGFVLTHFETIHTKRYGELAICYPWGILDEESLVAANSNWKDGRKY